jgi:hypothetical protein
MAVILVSILPRRLWTRAINKKRQFINPPELRHLPGRLIGDKG